MPRTATKEKEEKIGREIHEVLGPPNGVPGNETLGEIQAQAAEVVGFNQPIPWEIDPTLYAKLSAPFDATYKDTRGGQELEYISGEQAVTRLNEALGVHGWSFRIVGHGIDADADECWVLGELTLHAAGVFGTNVRQQFGGNKIMRRRDSNAAVSLGDNLKGAATDALKKCAQLLGVGLYLAVRKQGPNTGHSGGGYTPRPQQAPQVSQSSREPGLELKCEECGEALKETKFKDGSVWTPVQLAGFGQRKHDKVLCMAHYREANQAAKAKAESANAPF
jgi:hypothetical protein